MELLKEKVSTSALTYIIEKTSGKSVMRFRGVFQEANDIKNNKNRNGRIYTSALWEKALKNPDFIEKMEKKRILGELDHPSDRGQIRRASHIITDAKFNKESGEVKGELEILNYGEGELLKALVEQGVQLAVSSRGFGDFLKDGCTVDPESYKLESWDVVLDPSVKTADVNRVAEKINESLAEDKRIQLFTEEKDEETAANKSKNEKNQSIKETVMEQKILDLMTENKNLAVDKAKSDTKLEEFTGLVNVKNEKIGTLEEQVTSLTAKLADATTLGEEATQTITEQSAENKKLKAANEEMTKKLEGYTAIEEEAVSTITEQKKTIDEHVATIKSNNELGERAADVIENLLEKKDDQDGEDDEEPEDGETDDEKEAREARNAKRAEKRDAKEKAEKDKKEKAKKEEEEKAANEKKESEAKTKAESEGKDWDKMNEEEKKPYLEGTSGPTGDGDDKVLQSLGESLGLDMSEPKKEENK